MSRPSCPGGGGGRMFWDRGIGKSANREIAGGLRAGQTLFSKTWRTWRTLREAFAEPPELLGQRGGLCGSAPWFQWIVRPGFAGGVAGGELEDLEGACAGGGGGTKEACPYGSGGAEGGCLGTGKAGESGNREIAGGGGAQE